MSGRAVLVFLLVVSWSVGWTSTGLAQATPVIVGIFPPGATVGKSVDWVISGQNLEKVRSLIISGGGVEVVSLSSEGGNATRARIRVREEAQPGFREVRLDGPSGVSNLIMVRIDQLDQVVEIEPNQELSQAQAVVPGVAVAGVLKALDVDHYRIKGTPGQKLTIDLEARRLGTSISPVVTILTARGIALAQGRESRAFDRDCRMSVVLPQDGICIVQVRDNTYDGNDQARYRLRVDPAPFATALFPLGGVRGETINVEISGGNLESPLIKSLTLPGISGALIDPGFAITTTGPLTVPGKIIVGEGPEILEPADHLSTSPLEITSGLVINGRIEKPGEVDGFKLAVRKGEKYRFRIEAAALGSWLDSVLSLKDGVGGLLGENDDNLDVVRPEVAGSLNAIGMPQGSPDSLLEYEAKDDATLAIEVSDRFGDGGPEYSYRLAIERDRPDFSIILLLGNANADKDAINLRMSPRSTRASPRPLGLLNSRPGDSIPLNFLITPSGRPGPVEVSVEGLPDDVTAESVLIRFPGAKSNPTSRADPVADFLQLKVASFAQPGLSQLRIVARASPTPDRTIQRIASGVIAIDLSPVAGRPITKVVGSIPLRILGEPLPHFVGPPSPATFVGISVPGPLLVGDQIDLKLEFDKPPDSHELHKIEASVEADGLSTKIPDLVGREANRSEQNSRIFVRALASIETRVGRYPIQVALTNSGGRITTKEVVVEVQLPIEVRATAESIFLRPGDEATLPVEIKRAPSFGGEVEILLEGLPDGVKRPKNTEIGREKTVANIRLEMDPAAAAIEKPVALRVVGMARMPGGNVCIESKNRPMIEARPAEKCGKRGSSTHDESSVESNNHGRRGVNTK